MLASALFEFESRSPITVDSGKTSEVSGADDSDIQSGFRSDLNLASSSPRRRPVKVLRMRIRYMNWATIDGILENRGQSQHSPIFPRYTKN